jgi:hypothetical protein
VRFVVALALLVACDRPRPAAEVADRGWAAHETVVVAGERAATCAAAGLAMQQAFADHRDAFVEALALDADRQRLTEATEWLTAHGDRYRDLEDRMAALADRCAADATVTAVFAAMENPPP